MLEKIFTQTQFQKRFPKAPAWRAEAFKQFQTLPLPTSKEEAWRYTDVNGMDFGRLEAVGDVEPQFESSGAQITHAQDPAFAPASDKLDAWTQAFGNVLDLTVPAGVRARLESTIPLEKSGALLQTVHVGAGAHLDFFEHYVSTDADVMFGQNTRFHVAENATLRYYAVQRFGPRSLSFATKTFHLSDRAQLTCFHADLGSRLSRTAVSHHFDGTHSEAPEHSAVFFGSHHQHFDLTTQALHHGTGTKSNILVKGALKDKASAVYRGVIRIDKDSRQTDSYLQDRVLHLNSGVKSNSIPSLFIDNNDVKASHGATVSKLSDQSLFYLRSRGLSRPLAEQLVVEGFLEDVVRQLPHERLREKIQQDIQAKIGQNDAPTAVQHPSKTVAKAMTQKQTAKKPATAKKK